MTPGRRIPELDGIRGLAISLVLVYHFVVITIEAPARSFVYYVKKAGSMSWTGVDLFFVLSGFLIGGILIDARESKDYFQSFYRRRFFRIVPLYALVLALAYIFTVRTNPAIANQLPLWPHVLFLQNFWMAATGSLGFFAVSWSLAIEEQFYLTLPSVVRYVSRDRLWYAVAGGIIAAPILRVVALHLWPGRPASATMLMPCRADALLLGVAGALLLRNERWKSRIETHPRALWISLAVLVAGAGFFSIRPSTPLQPWRFSLELSWVAALYLCLLLLAVTQPRHWIAGMMRWQWLCWLGTIAYGVYLLHQLIAFSLYWLVWHRNDAIVRSLDNLLVSIAALVATLVICQLSWRYFEQPLTSRGHRPA